MKDEQKYYLLLDEVQFMPRFDEGFVIMGMKYFLLNADSLEF